MINPRAIELPVTLNASSLNALGEAVNAISATDVVVLRANTKDASIFCRGMDFESFATMSSDDLLKGLREFARILHRLRDSDFISIAVVEGVAIGGGVGLAAACDVVIATDSARFGLPEALYGFSPAVVSVMLRERLTPQALRLLALRCDTIDANEAHRIGLADRVVNTDMLEKALRYEVRRLGRADVEGRRAIKQRLSDSIDITHALEEATLLTHERLSDHAVKSRLQHMVAEGAI